MQFINKPKKDCETRATEIIFDYLREITNTKGIAVLGVPGGRSVSGIFNLLGQQSIPWKKVHVFMVDERMVPLTHKDSNFRLTRTLVQKFPAQNIHPFNYKQGTQKYQQELSKVGGKYDVLLLSSGEDGHIGALFPDHHSIKNTAPYFLTMHDSPKPPPKRMTISPALVKKAQVAVVLFFGKGKQVAFEMFQDSCVSIQQCPAKLVYKIENTFIFRDN